MKRVINSSFETMEDEVRSSVYKMIHDKVGKHIYGKFILNDKYSNIWIEGVRDALEICNIDVPGFNEFLEAIYVYGVDEVRKACLDR